MRSFESDAMPIGTPLHPRTQDLCTSLRWKEWAGYHAVCSYDTCHELEYFAIRHRAGLLDVSPLQKLAIEGPDAAEFLASLLCRDPRRLRKGQVSYGPWCDAGGRVVDDGTVTRLGTHRYRLTSVEPALAWFAEHREGWEVELRDETESIAAVALQGPTSRRILADLCGPELEGLRFFRARETEAAGIPITVTRTGYTGDLGYELWVESDRAPELWDALMDRGAIHGITPVGLDALDVTRIEAGFILLGVDYRSARHAAHHDQTSSPFELGLGWAVDLDRGPFLGREALEREARGGSPWSFVGLDIDYPALEALWVRRGLPIELPHAAWRTAVPVYRKSLGPLPGTQVGQATSGVWSPICQRNLALATVQSDCAEPGTQLEIEVTVEFVRERVPARVVATPFFDPARKKA